MSIRRRKTPRIVLISLVNARIFRCPTLNRQPIRGQHQQFWLINQQYHLSGEACRGDGSTPTSRGVPGSARWSPRLVGGGLQGRRPGPDKSPVPPAPPALRAHLPWRAAPGGASVAGGARVAVRARGESWCWALATVPNAFPTRFRFQAANSFAAANARGRPGSHAAGPASGYRETGLRGVETRSRPDD